METLPFRPTPATVAALVLGAILLLAADADAQAACLTGPSALQDQRALAGLRAAIDAACPCASFAGTSGAGRSAYRRCARAVREAALAAGELRDACRQIATRGYFDTTCGTAGKVTCGRVTAGAKRPVTCRITSSDACRSRGNFTETACRAETHCSDVVDWTAGTCVDVRERGPFEAGARTITFTKPSVENPTAPRPLETVIWYPTEPGAGAIAGNLRAVVDAPLAASGKPYPVLLFSHGLCGSPTQSLFLTPLLAAQGFIVVAPPHPGNTTADIPACLSTESQLSSFRERPHDVVFVLDQLLAANADPSSPFFGAIDPERIGMSGHSFGGLTTYLVEDIEPRVKVAIPLAPAVLQPPALAIPSLTMLGQLDARVALPPIRAAYAASSAPKYLIEIADAGHYAFSDFCRANSDCNPPVTLTSAEAQAHVLRWVRPFLELHLNHDQSFAPFFLTPLLGEVVQSQRE